MAAWTKADFYAAYSICPRGPNNRRYTEIRLHYHPAVMRPIAARHADKILAALPITASDRVVVFGAGFGWLCEELIARTGCRCVGVDNSAYIHASKDQSPDDELLEAITARGLSNADGVGLEIWNRFSQPTTARTTATIMDETLQNRGSRNRIESRLGGSPTLVVTEDVWQTLTNQERSDYGAIFSAWSDRVLHFIDGKVV